MAQQAIYEKNGYTENQMCMLLISGSFQEIQPKETFFLALGIGSFYPHDPFETRKEIFENCIELYKIKNIYSKINRTQKSIHDEVNEVKIDYIFSTLINIHDFSQKEVIDNLLLFIEESDLQNKESVIKYIKSQYAVK